METSRQIGVEPKMGLFLACRYKPKPNPANHMKLLLVRVFMLYNKRDQYCMCNSRKHECELVNVACTEDVLIG